MNPVAQRVFRVLLLKVLSYKLLFIVTFTSSSSSSVRRPLPSLKRQRAESGAVDRLQQPAGRAGLLGGDVRLGHGQVARGAQEEDVKWSETREAVPCHVAGAE